MVPLVFCLVGSPLYFFASRSKLLPAAKATSDCGLNSRLHEVSRGKPGFALSGALNLWLCALLVTGCSSRQETERNVGTAETVMAPATLAAIPSSTPASNGEGDEQYVVASPYNDAHHYQITYSPAEWHINTIDTRDGPGYPELEHLNTKGCRLYLREGPRGLLPLGETSLAGYTWRMYEVGESYPNHIVYSLDQPDKGIAFIIGLDWSQEAARQAQEACRLAAEGVLDTVVVLD